MLVDGLRLRQLHQAHLLDQRDAHLEGLDAAGHQRTVRVSTASSHEIHGTTY